VRISVVMDWTEHGYALLWTKAAPAGREMRNAQSALDHHEFVSGAVAEMLVESAGTRLPPGENRRS